MLCFCATFSDSSVNDGATSWPCHDLLFPPVQERTKNAQFIIISLRNNMFELADRLVGIYKTDNCTKSVTIDPNKLSQGLRPAVSTQAWTESRPIAFIVYSVD